MKLRIGLFGIGLKTYWEQFEGLEARLLSYLHTVHQQLEKESSVEVTDLGLIDDPGLAMEAGHAFRRADIDLLFIYVSTYALSSTVLPVVTRAGVPILILNLSPEPAIDYHRFNKLPSRTQMTGEWLAYCAACPVPELANVFRRAQIEFYQITGILKESDTAWEEISDWIAAARVKKTLAHNRLGAMGTYYSGMLDIYTDLTAISISFGCAIELLEVDELSALRRDVTTQDVEDRVDLFKEELDVQQDCDPAELERAARTSVALDRLVERHQLGSLAYYYKGTGVAENEDTMSSIIVGSTMMTAKQIPVAGEYEIKNSIAMKILDSLGAGGSFSEFYAVDYKDEVILLGHDGPGHCKIAQGKIKVKPLKEYHGKVGKGLSVEMSVRQGPVTLLSVVESADKRGFCFLIAEAEAVAGPILEIGNTNSRYRFPIGVRNFIESWNAQGPAHHCAIGTGHQAAKLEKLGNLLNINTIRIC